MVLNIVGTKTYLPANFAKCEGELFFTTLVSLSYDLDIVNITENLATRIVSILVQVVYEDPESPDPECPGYVHDIYYVGNRQFDATIDTLYGEKYTGVIPLKSELIDNAVKNIKDFSNSKAAIQLLVYSEDGLEVFVPGARSDGELANVTAAVSQTTTPPVCPGRACRDANGNCVEIPLGVMMCRAKDGSCFTYDNPDLHCTLPDGSCGNPKTDYAGTVTCVAPK